MGIIFEPLKFTCQKVCYEAKKSHLFIDKKLPWSYCCSWISGLNNRRMPACEWEKANDTSCKTDADEGWMPAWRHGQK